jgi:hypothetical protein
MLGVLGLECLQLFYPLLAIHHIVFPAAENEFSCSYVLCCRYLNHLRSPRPLICMVVVDVRNVACAHLKALDAKAGPTSEVEKFILVVARKTDGHGVVLRTLLGILIQLLVLSRKGRSTSHPRCTRREHRKLWASSSETCRIQLRAFWISR